MDSAQILPKHLQHAAQNQKAKKKIAAKISPYLFLFPAISFFVVFSYFPFLKTIYMSMTITDVVGRVKKFVGFENFSNIFARRDFITILLNTAKFVPMVAIPSILIGFALALIADHKVRGFSRVYEILFCIPMAVASASAAIVWSLIFNPAIGTLNYILGTNIKWLTDSNWAMFSVAVVTVWLQFGVNFVFLLTSLRGVSQDLKESAKIDGANFFQRLYKITLPMISPTLFFVIFFNVMSSFQAFGQIRLLTQGGPGISTKVLVYDIYLEAFMNYRFGSACAESLILFVIMLTFTLLQFKFENKGVHYS